MLAHHNLEKYDYNQFFYTPRSLSTMGFTFILINVLAYILVPKHDAGEWNDGETIDGFKYTSKMYTITIYLINFCL